MAQVIYVQQLLASVSCNGKPLDIRAMLAAKEYKADVGRIVVAQQQENYRSAVTENIVELHLPQGATGPLDQNRSSFRSSLVRCLDWSSLSHRRTVLPATSRAGSHSSPGCRAQ